MIFKVGDQVRVILATSDEPDLGLATIIKVGNIRPFHYRVRLNKSYDGVQIWALYEAECKKVHVQEVFDFMKE